MLLKLLQVGRDASVRQSPLDFNNKMKENSLRQRFSHPSSQPDFGSATNCATFAVTSRWQDCWADVVEALKERSVVNSHDGNVVVPDGLPSRQRNSSVQRVQVVAGDEEQMPA